MNFVSADNKCNIVLLSWPQWPAFSRSILLVIWMEKLLPLPTVYEMAQNFVIRHQLLIVLWKKVRKLHNHTEK